MPLQTQPAATQNLRPKCPVSAVFRAEGVTVAEPRALASESVEPKLLYELLRNLCVIGIV